MKPLQTISLVLAVLLPSAAEDGQRLKLLTPAEWQARMAREAPKEPDPETRVSWIVRDAAGIAISGYDPVAYFQLSRAVSGKPEFVHEYRSVRFRFVSDAHRKAFAKDPESFLPQYGGHCAYSAAKGRAVPGSPSAWRILAGKLYFAESPALLLTWERDEALLRPLADGNWPRLHK